MLCEELDACARFRKGRAGCGLEMIEGFAVASNPASTLNVFLHLVHLIVNYVHECLVCLLVCADQEHSDNWHGHGVWERSDTNSGIPYYIK